MEQPEGKKSNFGTIVVTIIVTALIVGGGVYYLKPESSPPPTPTAPAEEVELTDEAIDVEEQTPEMTLLEYYKDRKDFKIEYNEMHEDPGELGLKEIARVEVACPENADGPCGFDLIILSKDPLHSGNQEFYLSEEGGAGYTYYGPFTDDLERIVEEASTIKSLNEI